MPQDIERNIGAPIHGPELGQKRGFNMPDVLISTDTKHLKTAESGIRERIEDFRSRYVLAHPGKADDPRVKDLFWDMDRAGFWHVLSKIDGIDANPGFGIFYDQDLIAANRDTRRWAVSAFTRIELEEIMGIVVDTALTGAFSDRGQPGFKRGHSILYSDLVVKPESMFSDLVTPEFVRRLNNGRFWEHLATSRGQRQYRQEVEEVLDDHFSDLDLDFFDQGYEIFKRNGGENPRLAPELTGLSEEAVERYWDFITRVDQYVYERKLDQESRNLPNELGRGAGGIFFARSPRVDERVAHLVNPYVRHIYNPDNDGLDGRNAKELTEKFGDPLVQRYIAGSELIRDSICLDLQDLVHKDPKVAARIIKNIPRPREIVARLISAARLTDEHNPYPRPSKKDQLMGLSKMLQHANFGIVDLLSPQDEKLK